MYDIGDHFGDHFEDHFGDHFWGWLRASSCMMLAGIPEQLSRTAKYHCSSTTTGFDHICCSIMDCSC